MVAGRQSSVAAGGIGGGGGIGGTLAVGGCGACCQPPAATEADPSGTTDSLVTTTVFAHRSPNRCFFEDVHTEIKGQGPNMNGASLDELDI